MSALKASNFIFIFIFTLHIVHLTPYPSTLFSVFHGPTFREIEPSKDSKAEDSSPKIWFGSVSPFFNNGLRKEKQSPRDFMLKENYLDTPKAIETPSKGYEAPVRHIFFLFFFFKSLTIHVKIR